MAYKIILSIIAVICLCTILLAAFSPDKYQELIRNEIELMKENKGQYDTSFTSFSSNIIPIYYHKRNYNFAWTKQRNIDDLFQLILEMENEGLNPNDYHLETLTRFKNFVNSKLVLEPNLRVHYDLMLSDALLRIMYNLIFGKVDPEQNHPSWNIYCNIDIKPLNLFQKAVESQDLYKFINDLKVQDHFLIVLRNALKRYQRIAADGGWDSISKGSTIEIGMADERVLNIRKHLLQTRDLSIKQLDSLKVQNDTSITYDSILFEAVKNFQRRHGLTDDGKIGKKTVAALNVSVDKRIQQIVVNLERGRWIYRNIEDEYILVNIAAFYAVYVRNGKVIWRSRTQVGTEFRQTPVFKADLKYLEFNPTWTVPPTILEEDILPELKKDISYLNKNKMILLNSTGDTVSPSVLNMDSININNFPYRILQKPGSNNALGLVKFMFPNKHRVFIHDTPSKILFEKEIRTFSSGCIRVEKPLKLAELVLNDTLKWHKIGIQKILDEKKTKIVPLKKSIPILLIYATASPYNENDTIISFHDDIYQWDEAIYKQLNSPFKKRKRHNKPSKL